MQEILWELVMKMVVNKIVQGFTWICRNENTSFGDCNSSGE